MENDPFKRKFLVVFGTRPEGIKMAPVVSTLRQQGADIRVCVTGQHKEMLTPILHLFGINPDFNLDIMKHGQDLSDVTSKVLIGVRDVLCQYQPSLVLVHGDTTTSFAATLASFYMRIPIGHVEAGLRTHDIRDPWPEEANRRMTGQLAHLHFAPTERNRENLLSEGVPSHRIFVTGNTVIDALLHTLRIIQSDPHRQSKHIQYLSIQGYTLTERRFILLTAHRREQFDSGFHSIFLAIKELALKYKDYDFVYPVHLNPNVTTPANELLGNTPNIHLIKPLEYETFVYLMSRAHIIVTDSGGIQEEAPTLGKPVAVIRNTTERREAVAAGTVKLVGTKTGSIIDGISTLLDSNHEYDAMCKAHNPYGDGQASDDIARILLSSSTNFE